MSAGIEVDGLNLAYDSVPTLSGIDLCVDEGESSAASVPMRYVSVGFAGAEVGDQGDSVTIVR